MKKIELKICRKCGGTYVWTRGGIVMTPIDYADRGLCPKCRVFKLSGVDNK